MTHRIAPLFLAAALTVGCQSESEPAATAAETDTAGDEPVATQLPETPPEPATAVTLLGEPLDATDAETVQQEILSTLFDRYAAERGLVATDEEIQAFIENLRKGMAEEGLTAGEDDLSAEEKAQVDEMRAQMARSMIRQWKINRALYEQYGGRIIYQQFGPEPLDAYRQFLEAQRDAGAFSIDDPTLSEAFWSYFTDESRHDFMDPDGEDAKRAFTEPPWSG